MAANRDIPAEEFLILKIAKAYLGELNKGSWIVNQKGLRELVIDCDLSSKQRGYSLKTLKDCSGHLKIIEERSYEGTKVDQGYNILFTRLKSERFMQGQEGYEQRCKLMEEAGYDMSKLGGGR